MLDLIWDVVSGSAFMRWFLLGALVGLILSILAYLIGLPIYGEHALLAIAGGGLLSVLGRFGVWVARR